MDESLDQLGLRSEVKESERRHDDQALLSKEPEPRPTSILSTGQRFDPGPIGNHILADSRYKGPFLIRPEGNSGLAISGPEQVYRSPPTEPKADREARVSSRRHWVRHNQEALANGCSLILCISETGGRFGRSQRRA